MIESVYYLLAPWVWRWEIRYNGSLVRVGCTGTLPEALAAIARIEAAVAKVQEDLT